MSDKTGISWTDATGRRRGVLIRIARRAGVSAAEFAARVDAGQKWCWRCERWLCCLQESRREGGVSTKASTRSQTWLVRADARWRQEAGAATRELPR